MTAGQKGQINTLQSKETVIKELLAFLGCL